QVNPESEFPVRGQEVLIQVLFSMGMNQNRRLHKGNPGAKTVAFEYGNTLGLEARNKIGMGGDPQDRLSGMADEVTVKSGAIIFVEAPAMAADDPRRVGLHLIP